MEKKQSHYFIDDDTVADKIERFNYYLGSTRIILESNAGLFSPGHVDCATDLLLQTIPPLEGSLLDLGCGYGVIGVSAAKAYGVRVTMADVTEKAVTFAQKNCKLNGVNAQVIKSDCFDSIDEKFDTITLNPPIHAGKEVIFKMYRGAFEHLNDGGKFYVVIQKKHGAESTIKQLEQIFGVCEVLYKKKGYYVLCSRKVVK